MNENREPNYPAEPSYDIRDALALVPLFYTIDWTEEKKAEWLRITGTTEATTKVMCDHIRSALAVYDSQQNLMRDACEAAIAYDKLIEASANDPSKMSSATTAQGDDLDDLYESWITKSRLALGMAPPK